MTEECSRGDISDKNRYGRVFDMSGNEAGKKTAAEGSKMKSYKKRLFKRSLLLYAVLAAAFVISLFINFSVYSDLYEESLDPQIRRTAIQVGQIIPQLQKGEADLMHVFNDMAEGLEDIETDGVLDRSDVIGLVSKGNPEQFSDDVLSWMDRVTRFKVGRDGSVVVLDKDNMTVIAHPDKTAVGICLSPRRALNKDNVLDLKSITADTREGDIKTNFNFLKPVNPKDERFWRLPDINDYLFRSLYGCVMEYDDYYIICGISYYERLSFLSTAFLVTVILFILIWIIIKWIGFVMEARSETAKSMRAKLIVGSLIICLISFAVSVYMQTLSNLANDLRTLSHHADVAAETLETYKAQSKKLGSWLDYIYETECRIASLMIQKEKPYPDRDEMQKYADYLKVKYVFLFDEEGKVIVTNSNYDHLQVGSTPEEPFYDFQPLLEGTDSVIMPPEKDERHQEYLQYIGVSIRNEKDLCDGFVMIAVDPALRDELLNALKPDKVLSNIVMGLPEYAIAVDNETMQIAGTTGLGYVGAAIEELDLTQEDLEQKNCSSVMIDETEYEVGISESENYYILPFMEYNYKDDVYSSSFILLLEAAVTLLIIILLTLFRFQEDVLDAAPAVETDEVKDEKKADVDDDFAGMEEIFSDWAVRQGPNDKKGFEERWNVSSLKEADKTPEGRIKQIIYYILLIFCLFVLLPTLYAAVNTHSRISAMNTLAYVISGKWEKEVNIFAVTSCVLLFCAMYVGSVMANMILFTIAKANDTRVETVCLLIRNAIKYLFLIIFIYYGLSKFGVNTKTLLASAGILSLMVSLGAKDMVSDILAGFFIIFECSYKVGDYVEIGSWSGIVTEIGLRTTRVKRGSRTKIFNNSSMRDIVSTDPVCKQSIKIAISYDQDIDELERIFEEELEKIGPDQIPGLKKGPFYDGISSFEDDAIMIQIGMRVDSTYTGKALSALSHEVKLILERCNIERPNDEIYVHNADQEQSRD